MTLKPNLAQRQKFYRRHQAGEISSEIGQAYGLSRECIRSWCRRQGQGLSARTSYRYRAGGLFSRFEPLVRYAILRLRQALAGWGPSRVRSHLSQRPSLQGKALPQASQIWCYRRQGLHLPKRRKRQRCPSRRPATAMRVHQRWQVDFKLGIPLSNGTLVNLHTVHDEVGAP